MPNPFEERGPMHGNAYENTPADHQLYEIHRMPSPAQFHPSVTTYKESTKVLEEENQWSPPPQNTNAYQYSGTPYNNNDIQPATDIPITPIAPEKVDAEANVVLSEERHKPSKIRGLFRLILLVFSVGYLGFAAGASPFSGVPVPFDNQACFHFLYAVAVISFLVSAYHITLFLFRRFGRGRKLKRYMLILSDFLLALMWGIGIIIEIIKFRCPVGGLNGWCNFYNTSIFFGFVSFVLYVVVLGWDIVGSFIHKK